MGRLRGDTSTGEPQYERPSFTMDPQRTDLPRRGGAGHLLSRRPGTFLDGDPYWFAFDLLCRLSFLCDADRSRLLCAQVPSQALSLASESSSPKRAVCGATRQLVGLFLAIGFSPGTAHRRELVIRFGELQYEKDSSDPSEERHVRTVGLGRLLGSSKKQPATKRVNYRNLNLRSKKETCDDQDSHRHDANRE